MKVLKILIAVFLAIIFSFITRHYLSNINLLAVGEFTPVPHFFHDVEVSYQISLLFMFLVYLLIFLYLVNKKYFNFAISMIGILLGLRAYKTVTETFLPADMVFVPALLSMGKTIFIFMAVGICVQWVFDGGLTAIRFVNKNN
jgi:hypothetical protein